jgi:hypothetical protein
MTLLMRTSVLVRATIVAAVSCVALDAGVSAQARSATRSGPTPTLPDWSGAWIRPFEAFVQENSRLRDPANPIAPRLTPAYAALLAESRRGLSNRGFESAPAGAVANEEPRRRMNSEDCLPTGMPNMMRYAFAFEFLFTPGRVTIILEHDDTSVRRIYTDGRPHSDDPDPTYNGESIGRWEGETLVVHTTAISRNAELIAGVPTSGHAAITERIHLVDKDHLQIDVTVEDPIALLAPWRVTRVYDRTMPMFFERHCVENNREKSSDRPDLTPPKP